MQNFVRQKDKTPHTGLTQDQRSGVGFAPKLLLVITAGIKSPAGCAFPVFLGHTASCVVCGCLNTKAPARQSSALGSLQPVCTVNSFCEVRRQIFTTDIFPRGIPDSAGQLRCLYPEVTGIGTFCLWKLLLLPASKSKRK